MPTLRAQVGSQVAEAQVKLPPSVVDPRTYDYAGFTGPQLPLTSTRIGANEPGTKVSINKTTPTLRQAFVGDASDEFDTTYIDAYENTNYYIGHVESLGAIKSNPDDKTGTDAVVEFVRLRPNLASTVRLGAVTGAAYGTQIIRDSELICCADGITGPSRNGGGRALAQRVWIHPVYSASGGIRNYFMGKLAVPDGQGGWTVGKVMSEAQTSSVRKFVAGGPVSAGDFITAAPGGGGSSCYQILATPTGGGVLQSSSGWTTTPFYNGGSIFQSNGVTMICLGPHYHQDGLQWTGGGQFDLVDSLVEHLSNSCLLIQSASSSKTNDWPVRSVRMINSLLRAGINYWLYIQGQGNNADGTTKGTYTRDAATGTWTLTTNLGDSRPHAILMQKVLFDTALDGTQPALDFSNVIAGTKQMVKSIADWKAAVKRQYPDASDATIDALWDGNLPKANLPAVDQTVLEARFQAGNSMSGADALGAVVCDDARRIEPDGTTTPMAPAKWATL